MKKEKRNYEAPSLTVVSFKTEKGYATSGQLVEPSMTSEGYGHNNYEADDTQTSWGTF